MGAMRDRVQADRRAGPVLSDVTSQAIADAVFHELAAAGYGRLTIDAVARRASVGKAAIYRRWSSKQEMVLAVVEAVGIEAVTRADTGSLRGDLRAAFEQFVEHMRHPLVARIVPDLLAETARDTAFGAAMHERVGVVRRDRGLALVRRAVLRGELPEHVDEALAADLIAAPLYWRLAVTREPFAAPDLHRLVEVTIAALRAAGVAPEAA